MLLITQSVDNIVVATDTAFIKALLVTSNGSIIPALIMSTFSPVITFNPLPFICPINLGKFSHSIPALFKITLKGYFIAPLSFQKQTWSYLNPETYTIHTLEI